MKYFLSIVILVLFFYFSAKGQNDPFAASALKEKGNGLEPGLNITLGYVPKSTINAVKVDFAFTNLLFKRVGVYTSFEKGLDSDYFSNIYGLLVSLHEKVYIQGGIDLFTQYSVFKDGGSSRKELGIGYNPWKKLVVNAGWSSSIGITFGAGIKIPL